MNDDDAAAKVVTAIQGVGVVREHEDFEQPLEAILDFARESFEVVEVTPTSPATRGGKS